MTPLRWLPEGLSPEYTNPKILIKPESPTPGLMVLFILPHVEIGGTMRDDIKTLKNSQGLLGTRKDSERFRKTPKDSEKLRIFISDTSNKIIRVLKKIVPTKMAKGFQQTSGSNVLPVDKTIDGCRESRQI
ncbi:hypothetical protein PV325_013775 [Microctonus aethiopoides]|nr:hypothetical protein PV325_013775 [Microctonus aethiopoides]